MYQRPPYGQMGGMYGGPQYGQPQGRPMPYGQQRQPMGMYGGQGGYGGFQGLQQMMQGPQRGGGYAGLAQQMQGYGGASLSRQGYGSQMGGGYGGMNYGGPSFGAGFVRQSSQPQAQPAAPQGFVAGKDQSAEHAAFSQRLGALNPDAQWNPTAGAGGGYWTKRAGSTLDDAEFMRRQAAATTAAQGAR